MITIPRSIRAMGRLESSKWIFIGEDSSMKKGKKYADVSLPVLWSPAGKPLSQRRLTVWLIQCERTGGTWLPDTAHQKWLYMDWEQWKGDYSADLPISFMPLTSSLLPSPVSHLVCSYNRNLHRLFLWYPLPFTLHMASYSSSFKS